MTTKTAIVGLGVTGMSVARFLRGSDDLVVLDSRAEPPFAAEARREFADVEMRFGVTDFDPVQFDRAVLSPGLPMDHCLVSAFRSANVRCVSDIDLFMEHADAPVIAITGTNGKSTVTALTGHLLEALGADTAVGGNLGEPALDLLGFSAADNAAGKHRRRDCYVLELSSFQLERSAQHDYAAAAVLNVTADHLDVHHGMAAYAATKRSIYRAAQRTVCNRADQLTWPEAAAPTTTFGLSEPEPGHWGLRGDAAPVMCLGDSAICTVAELPLAGTHNVENALAAMALVDVREEQAWVVSKALGKFRGLPHRCEFVADVGGVQVINDSKATNVGATVAALRGIRALLRTPTAGVILIAGGEGKAADFSALATPVSRFVKHLVLIGDAAPAIAAALPERVSLAHCGYDFEGAVDQAFRAAQPGDVVLLAPACASFDMFRDYRDRGTRFRELVAERLQ